MFGLVEDKIKLRKAKKLLNDRFSMEETLDQYTLHNFYYDLADLPTGSGGADVASLREFHHCYMRLVVRPGLHSRNLRTWKYPDFQEMVVSRLDGISRNQDRLLELKLFIRDSLSDPTDPTTKLESFVDFPLAAFSKVVSTFRKCEVGSMVLDTNREKFIRWRERRIEAIESLINEQRETLERLVAAELPLEAHILAFKKSLECCQLEDLLGDNQAELVELYKALFETFDRNGLVDINRLATVPKDVHRINQIETIIDLYNLKIDRTQNDTSMSDEVRERKVQALQHLMEKDIDALGGVV